jgi:hypothetical protein
MGNKHAGFGQVQHFVFQSTYICQSGKQFLSPKNNLPFQSFWEEEGYGFACKQEKE